MITRTSTTLLQGLQDLTNGAAWKEFDARYRPLLMAVARRLGLAEDDAEDSVQETMAAFMSEYAQGRYSREKGRLRDWLCGIMTHKSRDIQRRQRGAGQAQDAGAMAQIEDTSVQAAMEAEWSIAVLRQCLEEIRQEVQPRTLETFELFVLKQWPAEQVAKRCGVSADVVYQNKRRVLQRIRELLPRIEEIW